MNKTKEKLSKNTYIKIPKVPGYNRKEVAAAVKSGIFTSWKMAYRTFYLLMESQTSTEINSHNTIYDNGVGPDITDAPLFTRIYFILRRYNEVDKLKLFRAKYYHVIKKKLSKYSIQMCSRSDSSRLLKYCDEYYKVTR